MSEKKIYTLSQLTRSIQNVIQEHCDRLVWIKAEIVKLNYYSKTGHCYPALVEKRNGSVIAELRGNIWGSHFEKINDKFKAVLKEELKDDMTVVIQGSITFHPVHGLALNIIDIDPEYTLGELAREKAETIERLKAETLFDANKKLPLPVLPKTIAVISVDTSKGYQDFLNIIENNPFGYRFHLLLFPAVLQGERAIGSILFQLEQIKKFHNVFDAVAIIRGGGGEIGLSSFDNYRLAREIATFPIPVLTGIGHSTNETVSELVSYESFITPTKIAEFLLQKFHNFANPLLKAEDRITEKANSLFRDQKAGLRETARLFSSLTHRALERSKSKLEQYAFSVFSNTSGFIQLQRQQFSQVEVSLKNSSQNMFRQEASQLNQIERSLSSRAKEPIEEAARNLYFSEEKIRMLSPLNVLKRGYSITRQNGKAVQDVDMLDSELPLETLLFHGNITSRIISTIKPEENV